MDKDGLGWIWMDMVGHGWIWIWTVLSDGWFCQSILLYPILFLPCPALPLLPCPIPSYPYLSTYLSTHLPYLSSGIYLSFYLPVCLSGYLPAVYLSEAV